MYVCGPTVYDVPHIGHGRHVLVFDVFRRYLAWSGWEVRFVSNITDIEDKIIARANEEGRSPEEVVSDYETAWWEAVDGLGASRPDAVPRATEYVGSMIAYIEDLIARGHAYEAPDGVYFSVETLEGYGVLARQPLDSLRAGARVGVDEDKRHPFDFALWKKAKPGEPSWPSPWGAGRPGWHIECTVMALDLLGDDFDLHGAGEDLCFPHNENERAQALAGGHRFARYWLHHGMVTAGGEKMSKSVGNYTSLTDLLARSDPRAYRLLVLQSHYRSPLEVTPATLDRAGRSIQGLDNFARRVQPVVAPPDSATLERFRELMDDDFDTPAAMAFVFDLEHRANVMLDAGDRVGAEPLAAAVLELTAVLGLALQTGEAPLDPETSALVAERDAARSARDFERADGIREELVARGWKVEDTPSGTRVSR